MDYATARNAIPKRHEGTLEWVLRDNHYIDWIEDRTKFLWISGNPGVGKTGTIATHCVPI
jgi:DNA replication protein DnaC